MINVLIDSETVRGEGNIENVILGISGREEVRGLETEGESFVINAVVSVIPDE